MASHLVLPVRRSEDRPASLGSLSHGGRQEVVPHGVSLLVRTFMLRGRRSHFLPHHARRCLIVDSHILDLERVLGRSPAGFEPQRAVLLLDGRRSGRIGCL